MNRISLLGGLTALLLLFLSACGGPVASSPASSAEEPGLSDVPASVAAPSSDASASVEPSPDGASAPLQPKPAQVGTGYLEFPSANPPVEDVRLGAQAELDLLLDLLPSLPANGAAVLLASIQPHDYQGLPLDLTPEQAAELLRLLGSLSAQAYPSEEARGNPPTGGGWNVYLELPNGGVLRLGFNGEWLTCVLPGGTENLIFECLDQDDGYAVSAFLDPLLAQAAQVERDRQTAQGMIRVKSAYAAYGSVLSPADRHSPGDFLSLMTSVAQVEEMLAEVGDALDPLVAQDIPLLYDEETMSRYDVVQVRITVAAGGEMLWPDEVFVQNGQLLITLRDQRPEEGEATQRRFFLVNVPKGLTEEHGPLTPALSLI